MLIVCEKTSAGLRAAMQQNRLGRAVSKRKGKPGSEKNLPSDHAEAAIEEQVEEEQKMGDVEPQREQASGLQV